MAIVLTGRMFRPSTSARPGPENLSRALEDAGTLTSPLVPWNTCGAYMAATLGVATLDYLPYAFFNLVNPLIAGVLAYVGFKILRRPKPQAPLRPPRPGAHRTRRRFEPSWTLTWTSLDPRHVVLAPRLHPGRHRLGGRPGQHLALPVPDLRQRRRRLRAGLPGLHRAGRPADPDRRDPDRPARPA
jgi:hypothetical protein